MKNFILYFICLSVLFISCDNVHNIVNNIKNSPNNGGLTNKQQESKNNFYKNLVFQQDLKHEYTIIMSRNGYKENECKGHNKYLNTKYISKNDSILAMKYWKIFFKNSKYGTPIVTRFAWPIEISNNQYSIHVAPQDAKKCYILRKAIEMALTKEQMKKIWCDWNIKLGVVNVIHNDDIKLFNENDYKKWIKTHPETRTIDCTDEILFYS